MDDSTTAGAPGPERPEESATAPRPVGAPAWMDLTTHDLEGAQRFYGDLFGWEVVEAGPDLGGYRHATVDGTVVAGIVPAIGPDGAPADPAAMPARWSVYLAVEDVDAAVADAVEAGGTVVVPAMDIPGMGRMAFLLDAAGADVGLWEAGAFAGFGMPGTPGTPVWFECLSRDALVAEQFYRDALGWDITVMPGSGDGGFWYATHGAGEAASAGLCDASSFLPTGSAGYWRMYIAVESVDAAVERVRELGGAVLDGPMDSPFGRLATVADPEGASFQVIEPVRRDG